MYGNPYQNFIQQTTPQFNQFAMPQQPMQQPNLPMQDIIQVNGLEGAKAYQMAANSRVILMDMQEPVVYIKFTDGAKMGTVNAYQLTPIESKPVTNTNDFEARLKTLENKLEELSYEPTIEPKPINAKSRASTKPATDGATV